MRPLYVAVKLRETVMAPGHAPIADIWLVNEENVRGRHDLALSLIGPDGAVIWSDTGRVTVAGGEQYGQLLSEGVTLPPIPTHGAWTLRAELRKGDTVVADGHDNLFAADYTTGPALTEVAVIDTSGAVASLLAEARGIKPTVAFAVGNRPEVIVVGSHGDDGFGTLVDRIMEQVADGARLVVLDGAEKWAGQWDNILSHQAVQFGGAERLGNRGRLFAGRHPLLDGLPEAQAMGWEYQVCYRGNVNGLDLGTLGIETVVGLASQNRKDILTAVARIPYGRGEIVVSTLDILDAIGSDEPQAATAKRLVMNFLTE